MRKHRSVTEPHASLQYHGNTFQYQQELDNFTKSVIELEAVICHTSENPNPEILHEKSATHTLYLPQGADRFELRQCHANLKQFRDLESCTDELVTKRQQVFQSPLKQSTSIIGDINGNGPKQGINGGPLFRDESESHILGGIHLSRVYFSQHSINGKQTLQEAQSGDVQTMNETSRKSENKTRSKRRNVQFDERDAKRLLPMEAKKHPSHPNPSTNKRSIKGLFQKTSTQSKKLHRHRMFSDKYVYFFSESEHSSLNTDKKHCSQFKQHNSGFSGKQQDASTSSPSAQQRKTFETSFEKEEKNDSSEMQVVVDNDGRVLVNVLHGKQKTNQQPPSNTHQIDLQRPKEGYVNKHEHDMYDKNPPRQESSLPAGQTRHIYAKMKLDSSFSALHDATHFQDMNNEQTLLYPRGYGNRVLVVRNDEKPSGNDPAFPNNIPRYVQRDCEYGHHDHEGRYQPKTLPTSHDNHFRERQPARSAFNTVAKRSSFINYQVNTEQKSRNDGVGDTSCQIHKPIGDRRATSFSQTNPDHSFTSHQKATPKTIPESQETSQPNVNTSDVEIDVNNSQSRKDLTEDKSNAHLSNSNEQRYRCDWPACTKAFRHYSFLVLHRRIHTGERPYNCSWEGCNKQFRRSDDYQRHYRVHTGVKPYPCIICGKAFKRSDHRLFHYRAIHNMYKQ